MVSSSIVTLLFEIDTRLMGRYNVLESPYDRSGLLNGNDNADAKELKMK